MGLGESLEVVVAVLAPMTVCALPGIPLRPGTRRRVVGPFQALGSDLWWWWWFTGGRLSIALRSDGPSVQIVNEFSGWLAVAHSNAAASSVNDAPRRRLGWRVLGSAWTP